MKNKQYYFNKIKSTSGEIAHLANIMECENIEYHQLSEWKIRKSLLIEKLKIMLDETEGCILQSMEDIEK